MNINEFYFKVIARIYYYVNRSWSGKITVSELKQSNLLSVRINKKLFFFLYNY